MEILTCAAASAVLLMCWATLGSATVYFVGDATGWTTGVDYSLWTYRKTFFVGDTLVFNYAPHKHTVNEVPAEGYQSCIACNSFSTDASGFTTVTLNAGGVHYFLCGNAGHCSHGMKLAVNVQAPMPFINPFNQHGAASESRAPAKAAAAALLILVLLL